MATGPRREMNPCISHRPTIYCKISGRKVEAKKLKVFQCKKNSHMVRQNQNVQFSDVHLGTLFSAQGGSFRNPKVPANALFPAASRYGKGFLFFVSVSPIFEKYPDILFAFSWGDCFSEHNSDTGFRQLSTISRRVFFQILNCVKNNEVIDDKHDFRCHFVRFFTRFPPIRFQNKPRQSIPLEIPQTGFFSDF